MVHWLGSLRNASETLAMSLQQAAEKLSWIAVAPSPKYATFLPRAFHHNVTKKYIRTPLRGCDAGKGR